MRAVFRFACLAFCLVTTAWAVPPNDEDVLLSSGALEVNLDAKRGALRGLTNKLTDTAKSARDVAFTIHTDQGIIDSDRAALVGSHKDSLTATFQFREGDVSVDLSYRLRSPGAQFVEKLLTITNHSQRPLLVDTLLLAQVAFSPPPKEVVFHYYDVPINVFLRDTAGGIFLGIENSYFGLTRLTNYTQSLHFRPRWLLSPGQSYTSDPAFLGVYKNEEIYTMGPPMGPPAQANIFANWKGSTGHAGRQILDWGEIWAMQDFMRQVLTSARPPGKPYPLVYNACGGMEYLWRLREAPRKYTPQGELITGAKLDITEDERQFVKAFSGTSPWTQAIVHGAFRPAWVEPFRLLIDHLAEFAVDILHPGTTWLGNGGLWDNDRDFVSGKIEPNPSWLETVRYAKSKGMRVYGFEVPASNYFPDRPEWKYVAPDGKFSRSNCYANQPFVDWHREAISHAIREHGIPWWQFDEGWADVANGECYATNHGHLPGNVSYAVYHNIQKTTAELKRRHPDLWQTGIAVFQHHLPWILRTVDKSFTRVDRWQAHNLLFMPPGKNYFPDEYSPRGDRLVPYPVQRRPEYDLLRLLSLTNHLELIQPIWFADEEKRRSAQSFFRRWLAWANEHAEYLQTRRDLFGPPSPSTLEGSSHILNDRGFLFLFNPSDSPRAGSIRLNHWIGLKSGERFRVRELYPALVPRDYGIYMKGDELVAPLAPGTALVLELSPTEEFGAQVAPRTTAPVDQAFLTLKELKGTLSLQAESNAN